MPSCAAAAGRLPVLRGSGAAAGRGPPHCGTRHRGAPSAWSERTARATCTGAGAAAAVPVPSVPSRARGGAAGTATRAMVQRRRHRVGTRALRAGRAERARARAHLSIARRGWLSAGALGDSDTLGRVSASWRVVWRKGACRGAPKASRRGAGHAPAGSACGAQAGHGSERERVCGSADRSLIPIVRQHGHDTGSDERHRRRVLALVIHQE